MPSGGAFRAFFTCNFCCLLLFSGHHYCPDVTCPAFESYIPYTLFVLACQVVVGFVCESSLNDGEEAFVKSKAHVRDRECGTALI